MTVKNLFLEQELKEIDDDLGSAQQQYFGVLGCKIAKLLQNTASNLM